MMIIKVLFLLLDIFIVLYMKADIYIDKLEKEELKENVRDNRANSN